MRRSPCSAERTLSTPRGPPGVPSSQRARSNNGSRTSTRPAYLASFSPRTAAPAPGARGEPAGTVPAPGPEGPARGRRIRPVLLGKGAAPVDPDHVPRPRRPRAARGALAEQQRGGRREPARLFRESTTAGLAADAAAAGNVQFGSRCLERASGLATAGHAAAAAPDAAAVAHLVLGLADAAAKGVAAPRAAPAPSPTRPGEKTVGLVLGRWLGRGAAASTYSAVSAAALGRGAGPGRPVRDAAQAVPPVRRRGLGPVPGARDRRRAAAQADDQPGAAARLTSRRARETLSPTLVL